MTVAVSEDTYQRVQNQLIDMLGERNLYRQRARHAETVLERVLAYLDSEAVPDRAVLLALIEP